MRPPPPLPLHPSTETEEYPHLIKGSQEPARSVEGTDGAGRRARKDYLRAHRGVAEEDAQGLPAV